MVTLHDSTLTESSEPVLIYAVAVLGSVTRLLESGPTHLVKVLAAKPLPRASVAIAADPRCSLKHALAGPVEAF